MRTLITGSSGFIGSHLMRSRKLGRVFAYDKREGQNILDRALLDRTIEENGITHIVHCAALAGVRRGEEFRKEYHETNVDGTENVLRSARRHGVKHLISFSSSSVYGEKERPPLNEGMICNPKSYYGLTKLWAEHVLSVYKADDIQVTIVRPFTVYGKDGRGDMVIYKWINQIKNGDPVTFYGNGLSKRGYTNVADLVRGVETIAHTNHKFNVFNLGGSQVVSLRELLSIFIKYCPQPFKVDYQGDKESDVRESWADISRAKEWLAWEPKTDFEKEVAEIIRHEFAKSS